MIIPRYELNQSFPQNVSTNPTNTTIPTPRTLSSNQVSWQSALWPIIACMLSVMMQNAGRICHMPLRFSVALRSSPLICFLDFIMILVEFVWMLAVGCSVRTAARHIWYDRFDKDAEGRFTSIWDGHWSAQNETSIPTATATDPQDHGESEVSIPLETLRNQAAPHNDQYQDDSAAQCRPTSKTGKGKEKIKDSEALATQDGPSTQASSSSQTDPSTQAHDGEADSLEAGSTAPLEGLPPAPESSREDQMYPGSAIDRTWRLSMGAFLLGALPQMIKVFGMRGIPFTQAIIAMFLASFLLPEVLRLIAGTAGEMELYPMPIILHAKKLVDTVHYLCLVICQPLHFIYFFFLSSAISFPLESVILNSFSVSIALAFPITIAILRTRCLFKRFEFYVSCSGGIRSTGSLYKACFDAYSRLLTLFSAVFALRFPKRSMSAGIILYVFISLTIALPLICTGSDVFLSNYSSHASAEVLLSMFWLIPAYSLTFVPLTFLLLLLHLLYRMLFIGVFSKYPRKLSGIDGSISGFCCGAFILLNFCAVFVSYAFYEEWDPVGTFKPDWAEYLG